MDTEQSALAQTRRRSTSVVQGSGIADERSLSVSTASKVNPSPKIPEAEEEQPPRVGRRGSSGSSRGSSSDWEMDDFRSDDDALEDDEETGLTDADKRKRRKRKRQNTRLDGRVAHDLGPSIDEKQIARQAVIKDSIANAVLILLWYGFSIGISVFNKYVLSKDKLNFHYPLFFTSFHMIIQFGLASLVLYLIPSFRPKPAESSAADSEYQSVAQSQDEHTPSHAQSQASKPIMTKFFYLTRISPCGAATGLDIGLSNMSLRFITLTFYTMCKSSVLGFVLLFAFLFRLEKPSWRLAAIILTMAAGVTMMVAGETAFHALGFILIMSACFFSGFRWSLTQILLIRNPATSNPFSSIFFLAPVMFLTLVVFAFPVEGLSEFIAGFHRLVEAKGMGQALGILLFPGLLAFLMTASEFALLKRTSVVTLSVCGIFKEVLTILTAAGVFDEKLTPVNFSGLAVTIASIAVYNYMKFKSMREEAVKDAQIQVQRRSSVRESRDRRRSFPQTGNASVVEQSGSGLLRQSFNAAREEDEVRRTGSITDRLSPVKRPEDLE